MAFCTAFSGVFLHVKGGSTVICQNGRVIFEIEDLPFVEQHGVVEATRLVLERREKTNFPLFFSTHQLADFLAVSHKDLLFVAKHPQRFYKEIHLPKKGGGLRVIHAPFGLMKTLQYAVWREILQRESPSPYATAYLPHSQVRENALPHKGKDYLLKMDLADFFGSISYRKVLSTLFPSTLFPKKVGWILTNLCCYNGAVPQGAPTSPALSNLVMKQFDKTLGEFCAKRGVTYTRYCDDLTFSANRPLYDVFQRATELLQSHGFRVNPKKVVFLHKGQHMEVTGLTVNQKTTVPKAYKRALRQEVFYAATYGLTNSKKKQETQTIHSYYQQLKGKLHYVLHIEPQNQWFREWDGRLTTTYQKELEGKVIKSS